MKTIRTFIIAAIIGISCSSQIKAQDYRTAIGLRLGETSGLTFKQALGGDHAFEAIVGFWPDAFSITALGEKYVPLAVPGLDLYYGVGLHVAFETTDRYYYLADRGRYYFTRYGGSTGIGIDGMLGVEFKVPVVPLAFSLEIKPFVEFNTNNNIYLALDPGLGIKLAF